jgi:hypothetical protein
MGSQSESNKESIKEDLRTYLPGSFIIDLSGTSRILSDAASLYNATNLTRLIALTANTDSYWDMPFSPSDFPSVADIVGMLGMQFDSLTTDVQDALTNLDPTSPAFTDFLTNKFPGQTVEVMQELTGASDAEMATYSFLVLERAKVQAAEMLGIDPSILDYGSHPGGYLGWLQDSFSDPDTQDALNKINTEANAIVNGEITPVRQEYTDQQNEIEAQAQAEAQAEADRLAAEEAARVAAEEQAEADRVAAEAQAEADRIAQAEADRIAQAEADRIAAEEAQAEADRIAAEAQAEADRLAAEEAARVAAEEQAEADRLAAEEAARVAAEEQAEADRLAAEEAARVAAEEQAEADRLAAEEAARVAAEEQAEQARLVGEAQEIFKDQGYAPTPEEAEAFAGKTEQEIKDYIDPRQITYDEAKQAFEDEGYRATPEEIKARMGQGDETFTETTEQEVADYVDPRYVTEAEAIEAFEAANGYEPTAEEIQDRIGQAEYDYPTDAAGQEEYARNTANHEQSELEDLADYVDKRQITAEEVKEFAAQNGLEISDEEAERLAQQGDQAEIEAKSKEIFDDFDERFVTRSELEDIARAQNYDVANLSEEDYAELVGNGSESDVIKNIDSRATTIDELAEVFEQRTGIALDPFNPEDQKKLQDMLEGATADNGGSLTEEEFDKWAKENIEYDLGVQIGRLATGVRNAIFGTGPGGRPKTLQEILDDMLGPPGTGGFAGPSPLVITTTPSASASAVGLPRMAVQAEIKFPVPLPVNGPPIIIPLFDENGVYVGPSSAGELLVGENGVITQVKESIETTVGQITEQTVQIFDAAGNVIKAIPLAELDNPDWKEGDKNPFEIEVDENGVPALVDENGIPIDPETGFPVYEMPETEDEDDRLALLSDVEAAKEEVLTTLGDQLDTLGFDVEEVKDILSGVEESLVGVATLEDLETLREGIKEDLATELDSLGLDVDDINKTLDGLDSSINSVSTRVGLPARPDDPDTEEDESRPATGLYAQIDALVAEGASRAEAVDEVLSNLSEQLGTTKDDILEQLGTTEANLAADIAGVAEDVAGVSSQIEDLNTRIDGLVTNGISVTEATDIALSGLSDELGLTKEELLEQLGTTEANLAEGIEAVAEDVAGVAEDVAGVAEDVAGVSSQIEDLDTELNTRIDALVDQGATEYEALSGAISSLADDLNTTEDNILTAISDSDSDIKGLIGTPAVEDDPNTDEDESAPATGLYAEFGPLATKTDVEAVGTSVADLTAIVNSYIDQGLTNDEALAQAISDLSEQLNTTEEGLLESLGETEETILDAVEGVSAQIDATNVNIGNLNDLIVQYELDGKTRDEALSLAISDLSTDLGLTKEELLTSIGETEETILTRIEESEDNTNEYLTYISNIIGIPTSEITQEDIDGIVGLLGEEEAITEINNDIRLYDANFDGLINDIDIELLQGYVDAGVEGVGEIPATGLYADAAQRQLEIQGFITEQDEITRGLISQEGRDTRELVGQTALVNALASSGDLGGTRVDVSTPDPARINYIYDFQDIFATPQQKGLFPSPYGGPQRAQQQQIAQRRGIMSGPMQIGGTSRGPLQIGGMARGGKVDYDFTDEIMQIMSYGDN